MPEALTAPEDDQDKLAKLGRIKEEMIRLDKLLAYICWHHPLKKRVHFKDLGTLQRTYRVEKVKVDIRGPQDDRQERSTKYKLINHVAFLAGPMADVTKWPDEIRANRSLKISKGDDKEEEISFVICSKAEINALGFLDRPGDDKMSFYELSIKFGLTKPVKIVPERGIKADKNAKWTGDIYGEVLVELEAAVKKLTKLAKKEIPEKTARVDEIITQVGISSEQALRANPND